MEFAFSSEAGAGCGRAPEFLNVFDDEVGPAKMIHEWTHAGAVHRVGEITNQQNVLAELHQLADGEGAAQNAHVGMDTHDQDVLNAALLKKVIDLLAAVGDGVLLPDLDGCDLALPWIWGTAFAPGQVVTTAIGVVDGKCAFFSGIDSGPATDLDGGFGQRSFQGAPSLGSVFVKVHGFTGSVDNEDSTVASGLDGRVHGWGHFGDAFGSAFAPMLVPHIADDDGGFVGVPLDRVLLYLILGAGRGRLDSFPDLQRQTLIVGGGE